MKKSILALIINMVLSAPAFSVVATNIKSVSLCVTFDAYRPMDDHELLEAIRGGGRPNEATTGRLEALAKVLNDKLLEMKIRGTRSSAMVLLNGCGPKAITVELPKKRLDEFLSIVEDLGATYRQHDTGTRPRLYADTEIIRVVTEANNFLIKTAHALLNARSIEAVEEIISDSDREYKAWKKLKIQGTDRLISNDVIAANEHIEVSRELNEMHSVARQLWKADSAINETNFRKVTRIVSPGWGLSIQQLENLKKVLPELSDGRSTEDIFSEKQEAVNYHTSLSEAQKHMEARINYVENILWMPILSLIESDIINTESYELGALLFFKLLTKLEELTDKDGQRLISSFEIVDVLNRNLSFFRHLTLNYAAYEVKLKLGSEAVRAYEKILSYEGLDSYVRLLLTALLSEAGPMRIKPNHETLKVYEAMWHEMPMEKTNSHQALIPKKHFGRLFNAVAGLTAVQVSEGIDEIENWLSLNDVKVKPHSERNGTTLEIARTRHADARKQFLEKTGQACDSVLDTWLRKRKPR